MRRSKSAKESSNFQALSYQYVLGNTRRAPLGTWELPEIT